MNFQIIRHWSRRTLTPHTKERGIFSVFEEKKLSEKKIKANFIASRTTLCTQNIKFCMQKFFFEKRLFAYENRFAVEKKQKKFGPSFQNYLIIFLCRHQKNASHTISIYGNCMMSIFSKNENLSFLSPDCFIRIKEPQKWVYTSFQPFLEIVWKLYDKHFPTHLVYGIVW